MPTLSAYGEQWSGGSYVMKNTTHQAILDSVPPRPRRSKLEPYAALIRALRARGRSYREIVTILRDRCGLHVGTHTVFHFVRARARQTGDPRSRRRWPPTAVRRPAEIRPAPPSLSPDVPEDVWARIASVKRRTPASRAEPKAFAYNENEPLQLIAEVPPRTR